ncbi:unnamed protein product [Blepharisma stoltei]|uniref:Transmembrane protein 107 n=1 Tax=Blepharisma stoltei TaxID=1481888 RepID=A0AAU9KD77_9CILI|nr:unnamed protein product [Blepharisma stoltei]
MTKLNESIMPAKFLAVICQVVMNITILYTHKQNVYSSFDYPISDSDSDFEEADRSLLACAVISLLLLGVEILVLFSGLSLFYDHANIVEIVLHCLGVIITCWFILDDWRYSGLWGIWAFTVLIPFIIEVGIVINSKQLYNSQD